MTEASVAPQPYKESDSHVPNPLFVSGHIDTTGTGGEVPGNMDTISPIFAQARQEAFVGAGLVEPPAADEVDDVVDEPESPEDTAPAAEPAAEDAEAEATPPPAAKAIEDMTVPELLTHAQENKIDLTGATRKEEIKTAILQAQQTAE